VCNVVLKKKVRKVVRCRPALPSPPNPWPATSLTVEVPIRSGARIRVHLLIPVALAPGCAEPRFRAGTASPGLRTFHRHSVASSHLTPGSGQDPLEIAPRARRPGGSHPAAARTQGRRRVHGELAAAAAARETDGSCDEASLPERWRGRIWPEQRGEFSTHCVKSKNRDPAAPALENDGGMTGRWGQERPVTSLPSSHLLECSVVVRISWSL
jgi:hypothetical protein